MALPITVPYTFGNATTAIPLSNLDSDYATVYQAVNGIGNGSVALANVAITGGTVSGNTSLSNVTISSVSTPITVAQGGTGLSSLTANGVVYASSTSALATGSALQFDGTNFSTTGSATATAFIPSGSTVPTNGMYLPTTNTVALSTNTTERARIDSNGRVGIGMTPSGSYSLQIYGIGTYASGSARIRLNNSSTGTSDSHGGGIQMEGTTLILQNSENAPCTFEINGSERMRIDSSGNLLVGTTSAQSKLTVQGFVKASNSGSYQTGTSSNFEFNSNTASTLVCYFVNSSSTHPNGLSVNFTNASPNNSSDNFLNCSDNVGTRAQIYSNGGLANYSANNVNLSDETMKKDIQLAGNYLDKLTQIPVKTFLFNDQTDTDLNLGVIAQDVQAIAPELVSETNWGTEEEPKMRLSIYQTDLQYALMKAIQELKAEVDSLKQQLGK